MGIGEEKGTGKQSVGYGGRGGGTIEGGRLGVNVGYRGRVGGKSPEIRTIFIEFSKISARTLDGAGWHPQPG